MALIGSISTQGSLQGMINEANGVLTGVISSTKLLGGQVVGMRGLRGEKGEKGDAGTTDYAELSNKPSIEDVVLVGNKTFPELGLVWLNNTEIEEMLL